KQPFEMLLVVPAIELGLEFRIDVGPHHQQSGSARLRHRCLLDPIGSRSPASAFCREISDCARNLTADRDFLSSRHGRWTKALGTRAISTASVFCEVRVVHV